MIATRCTHKWLGVSITIQEVPLGCWNGYYAPLSTYAEGFEVPPESDFWGAVLTTSKCNSGSM